LAEATLAEQLRGLRSGCFNAGFAHTDDIGDGIVAEPIWIDPLVVAVSARHPLLAHKQVPLEELVRYPLVMADPRLFGQCNCELDKLLHTAICKPSVVEHVASMDMMLTLVAAGYGVGFANAARIRISHRPDVVTRPLAAPNVTHTTYLLRPDSGADTPPAMPLDRFVARLHALIDE
jgi:DNA-binding transcriptional LysR family regulator